MLEKTFTEDQKKQFAQIRKDFARGGPPGLAPVAPAVPVALAVLAAPVALAALPALVHPAFRDLRAVRHSSAPTVTV